MTLLLRKRKRRSRPLLARLKSEADRIISLWVRYETISQYGHCPLCPNPEMANPVECCFHFVRRKRLATRWDPGNLVGACNRCNWIEYRNPDPSRAWFIRNRGCDKYLQIVDQSAKSGQPTIEYLEEIIKSYAIPGICLEKPSFR